MVNTLKVQPEQSSLSVASAGKGRMLSFCGQEDEFKSVLGQWARGQSQSKHGPTTDSGAGPC